ncbi:archaea-specific SMC-related protein [Halostella pelagica]|uniref:archaea-specific SMC-related protein n=1 Tax=Halostella pelagica TaxID=2583824 RepID=UPI00108060DE|nr:archaea-specific SMC-related protein [Halostella pelagica]
MEWTVESENIAGIRSGSADIRPGRNVVQGANWQGKSSFLKAIETSMGTETPLTEGETSGRVDLETPEGEYSVELERRNDTVVRNGEPFLDDEYDRIRADLYAFLDEDNAIRQVVRRGDNLEELLAKPLDFENIEAEIADRKAERSSIERELEQAQEAARRLPSLQEDVTQLANELDNLEATRDELDQTDERDEDSDREQLSKLQAELSQTEQRKEQLSDSVTRIQNKLEEVREEYESLSVPDEDVTAELAEAREKQQSIQGDVDLLQSVYSVNKRVLEEDRGDLLTNVDHGLLEDQFNCWVCGGETSEDELRDNLNDLSERISELKAEAAEYDERAEELERKQDEIREAGRRRDDLERQIDDLETKLADRRESLESATERLESLDERIADLNDSVSEHSDELTEIKSEIKHTETQLDEKREELERAERQAERRSVLETEYEELEAEIESLRNRKEEIKRRTRDAFDDAIADLLDRFDTSFETARLTSTFDLVVARNGREASIDALSEGELELLGIVAALAGHEAFEVADDVPVMLLDQLGGLTEENLATLVDYLDDRVDILVFTAYPEHSSFDGNVIDPDEWNVITKDTEVAP